MIKSLLSILLLMQTPDTTPPVITWEPEKPGWGDTVTIMYHHDAPNAVFRGTLPLMASVNSGQPEALVHVENVSIAKLVIPDSVSYVRLAVFSIEDWDPPRCGGTIIELQTPKGWVSAEESLMQLRYSWLGFKVKRISSEALMKEIDSLRETTSSAMAKYVVIYGYILLGEIDSAWSILDKMRKEYPGDRSYSSALMEFVYGVDDKTIVLDSTRIRTLWKWGDERIVNGETDYGFLMWADYRWNEGNTSLSVKEREKLLLKASESKPLNYWYHYFLADHYLKAAFDSLKAGNEYTAVIDLILDGEPQKSGYEPYGGNAFYMFLPRAMLARAKILSTRGKYEAALEDFNFLVSTGLDQNVEREALFELGKVWQKLERYKRAEDAYIKALKLGNPDAEPALRGIYSLLYGSAGYEPWITEKLMPGPDDKLPMTQDFDFTDLDSIHGRWSDFKGKIIVVNIWNIGCSVCLEEITILNKLAEEYNGKGVEFIGFNGDGVSAIKGYLSDHPFNYRILRPDSQDYAEALTANQYSKPWQIVVDPVGRVRFKKGGAFSTESETEGIRLIIDQLLREQARGK